MMRRNRNRLVLFLKTDTKRFVFTTVLEPEDAIDLFVLVNGLHVFLDRNILFYILKTLPRRDLSRWGAEKSMVVTWFRPLHAAKITSKDGKIFNKKGKICRS